MPNGTYGGVRGEETEVGQKTFVSRPTRFAHHVKSGKINRDMGDTYGKSAAYCVTKHTEMAFL